MSPPAPVPANEQQRLERLRALAVLDSDAEPLFDALTRAAALVTGAPIALVSLIDAHRQWFKSNLGLAGTTQTSRDLAFCAHAILEDRLMEVADARDDARFAGNPLVTGDPGIRFYAGAPITLRDGLSMGTLCVIDREPRRLDDTQRAILAQLARAAAEALDQRRLAHERTEALQQSAEVGARLAQIVETTSAGTCDWNIDTGELTVNDRWRAMSGRTLSEPFDSVDPWLEHGHPDDRPALREQLDRHLRGETPEYLVETRIARGDGGWMWVRDRARVTVRAVDGRALRLYGIRIDIDARKRTELALAASEAFLDRTGQVAGVGGWELDLATGQVTWSDQTCRLHDRPEGHQPTLAEGISYYAPDARPIIEAAVQRGIAEGKGWDLELPMISATGRHFWGRAVGSVEFEDGKARRLVGAFQDITLRRRATQSLEDSERRFRKLFQYSLGLICTHDLDGLLLSVNPAAASSLGYTVAEMMGRNLEEFVDPRLHDNFRGYLARIAAEGSASGMLWLVGADGVTRIWQYHNVLDDEGDAPYVLGHAQDMTERLRHEEKLRDSSIRDPLTGCFNRRYLHELSSRLRDGELWGCIVVDLDRFKQVNDTYGHERGDEVLVAMGQFLHRHLRPDDAVVRLGGDEFLVLLKNADEGLTETILRRLVADRAQAPIGFTLGYAVRRDRDALDNALATADKRLYEARALRGPSAPG